MRCFTVADGFVLLGVVAEKVVLSDGTAIPAVTVGEEGRGRRKALLPVRLLPGSREAIIRDGHVRVQNVALAQGPTGAPVLVELAEPDGDRRAIVVFLTTIGFRGGNSHHGAPAGRDGEGKMTFSPLPGQIIARGEIAQGEAGAMGNGEQLIVLLPERAVVCSRRSGRLYGAPSTHVIEWDGEGGRLSALPLNEWAAKQEFADVAL